MSETLRNTMQTISADGVDAGCRPFAPLAVAVHLPGHDDGAHDGADLTVQTNDRAVHIIRMSRAVLDRLVETHRTAAAAHNRRHVRTFQPAAAEETTT